MANKRTPSIYQFKVVNGEITEEKRVPTLLPGHVFVTPELRKDYMNAARRHRTDGRSGNLGWDGKTFVVPPDTRPRFSVDIEKSTRHSLKSLEMILTY